MEKIISGDIELDATDKDILTIPRNCIGKARIGARNPTAGAITVTLQDRFTPDVSAGVPAPSPVTKDRYSFNLAAGASFAMGEHPVAKVINNFRATSSAVGVFISYMIELS